MIADPKVVSEPGTAHHIHRARVLLDGQLRQDSAFLRPVSKVRYVLPDGAVALITHEYGQTYIHLSKRIKSSSSKSPTERKVSFLAFGFGVEKSAAFTSHDGLAWSESAALPNWILPVSSVQIANKQIVVCGSAEKPFTLPSGYRVPANTLAFWVVDGRSGSCVAAYGIPAVNGEYPAGAVPALVYVGGNVVWCAVQTNTNVYAAFLDMGTTTYTPLGQIFSTPYAGVPYQVSYLPGGVRPGANFGDVYMLQAPFTGSQSTPLLSVFFQGGAPSAPLNLPTFDNAVAMTIGAGPPGSLAFEYQTNSVSEGVTEYASHTYIAQDIHGADPWGSPHLNQDILGVLGYWRGGWVRLGRGVASSAASASAPSVGTFNGENWSDFLLPPTTQAPQSFYSTGRFLVSPEGPWVFGANSGSLLGQPFPFVSQTGYAVFPLGPGQLTWTGMYF